MLEFFTVDKVFFTIFGYPMSYLEFFGTIFNLWCVWLVARHNIWTWPVGIVGIIFFGILFYQIQLYSDLFEQGYFLVTSFYGWWAWAYLGKSKDDSAGGLDISYNSRRSDIIYIIGIIIGTLLLGRFTSDIHLIFPDYFPEPASFPYLDAFTTVMSFAATILMIYKKIECWYLWIAVDVIGIGLYFAKEVVFISVLYLIFLILATKGLIFWKNEYKRLI